MTLQQSVMKNGRETHGHSTYDVFGTDGISPTLKTMQGGNLQPKIVVVGNTSESNHRSGDVLDSNGICTTLLSRDYKGPKQIAVKVKEATKKGYAIAEQGDSINFSVPNSKTRRGRVGKGIAQTLDTQCNQAVIVQKPRGFNKGGEHEIAPTLSANSWHENNLLKSGDIRVRKLTPRECWRLQGFPDWAFDKAQEVNSNSQLYKQAGNSVTVNVIAEIARRLK